MLMEVCKMRQIDFAIRAPSLRVGNGDLRPATASYHGYLAAISRVVQSLDGRGNAELTLDDAIHYDHDKRMGQLTFDHPGRPSQ